VEDFLAKLVVPLIVGILGSGIGVYVGQAVMREQISKLREDFQTHRSEIADTLHRVVFKDLCEKCGENKDERHAELLRQIAETKVMVQKCFDDFAQEFRNPNSKKS